MATPTQCALEIFIIYLKPVVSDSPRPAAGSFVTRFNLLVCRLVASVAADKYPTSWRALPPYCPWFCTYFALLWCRSVVSLLFRFLHNISAPALLLMSAYSLATPLICVLPISTYTYNSTRARTHVYVHACLCLYHSLNRLLRCKVFHTYHYIQFDLTSLFGFSLFSA